MLTTEQIQQAIDFLQTHKGVLPTAFKQLNPEVKNNRLYIDNRQVISSQQAHELISKFDQDPLTTGGAERLWAHLKKKYWGITRSAVVQYVKSSAVHQIHQPLPKKTTSRPIIPKGPNIQWQIDLIDFREYEQKDNYAMTAIDLFSKVCHAVPIKNKEAATVASALDKLLKENTPPAIIQTDNGSEFQTEFDAVLTKHKVKHIRSLPYNPTAQGSVEKLNGILKVDVQRMMTLKGTLNWAPLLTAAVTNHNSSVTRSTGFAPDDVTAADTKEIAAKLKANVAKPESDRVFAVGDSVRVALTADDRKTIKFRKGAKQNFSDQVYKIRSVSEPKAAGAQKQYLLVGSTKKYWANQLHKIPDEVHQDYVPGERPKPRKREKLDRLDKVDEDFKAPIVQVEQKEGARPVRNRTKRIYHGDYVYLG